mgnify:FL=1
MTIFSRRFFVVCVALSLSACGGSSSESELPAEPATSVSSSAADIDTSTDPDIIDSQDPVETVLISDQWQLVWQDEFDDKNIDLAKWTFEVNCFGGGNNEQQCYTDRTENAFIEQGILKLVALKENFTGP